MSLCASLIITQSSCMCVNFIKRAGAHERELTTTAVWQNVNGEVMLECILLDHSKLPHSSRNLGTRFVCASPTSWNKILSMAFEKELQFQRIVNRSDPITNICIQPTVSLSTSNPDRVFNGEFVLFPPDLAHRHEVTPNIVGWPKQSILKKLCRPSFSKTVKKQKVTIDVNSPSLPHNKYKMWWWYPNQLFLIPACVVDIVIFPIQFFMILDAMEHADK